VDCIGRTAQYYAWYEMYPNASVTYSNTVRAGDHFNASVTYEGNNSYSLFIADTTQGWSHTTVQSLSGAPRSSAEVIIEAPCCTFSGGILPLADFGTMSFTGAGPGLARDGLGFGQRGYHRISVARGRAPGPAGRPAWRWSGSGTPAGRDQV
jgi:hypothetical protein